MDDKTIEEKNQLEGGVIDFPANPTLQTNEEEPAKAQGEEGLVPEVVSDEFNAEPSSQAPPPIYEQASPNFFVIGAAFGIFLLIFFLILRLIFGGKSSAKKVELNYWGLWEEEKVMQPLIDEYQQKNKNIVIHYKKMDPQDYRQKLIAQINDGRGPDIFRYHLTWLPEIKEIVAPLPEAVMNKGEYERIFLPVFQKALKVGNYYYGIPLYIDGLVLIYNKSLFDKAGITKTPTNWEEVIDAATRLTVKDGSGNILTAGIALGTANNVEHFSDVLGLLFLQNGADLRKLDEKEAVDALRTYRSFAEPPNNFWDERMPNSITAFIQEKVAMIIAPSWEVLVIKTANPDLEVKVAPVPTVPGGEAFSLANCWVEGVSNRSKNQIEAWKFLRFLVEKESLAKLYEYQTKTRPLGTVYSRVDMIDLLSENQYLGAVVKQAKNFEALPLVARTYDNGLNDEIIKYLENAINSTIEGVSYEEAFANAKKGIDQVLAKFSQ